ncbi:hypothetical protein CEXT_558471 [Caerostris extrusa]|uniref:Uncharacterized protein n=1 Tax=Caerostris extrusa TaxID=172846 RepID=A0AAV4QV20_CAEEX|nr:hypothetical protein CEXT_558471 [Caerostris extrusa]
MAKKINLSNQNHTTNCGSKKRGLNCGRPPEEAAAIFQSLYPKLNMGTKTLNNEFVIQIVLDDPGSPYYNFIYYQFTFAFLLSETNPK